MRSGILIYADAAYPNMRNSFQGGKWLSAWQFLWCVHSLTRTIQPTVRRRIAFLCNKETFDFSVMLAKNAAAWMPPPIDCFIVFYYRSTIFLISKHYLNDIKIRVRHCSRSHTALPACLTCRHPPPRQPLPYRYAFLRLAAARTQPAQRHSQPPSFRDRRGRFGQVRRPHIPVVRGCGSCSQTWGTG